MKRLQADPQEIDRGLAVLFRPGDVVEMRIPNTGHQGTISGYFDDPQKLASALASQNGAFAGIYTTLNPCAPSLLARSSNRVRSRVRTATSDKDIAKRRWLLIDCDPKRPTDISASDDEHTAALDRAREIRTVLAEEGWPAPVFADSGNGAHLLYRVDLPNDAAATKLLEGVLGAMAARFSDAVVEIDRTVFNAARIVKAYGTVARKGDDLRDQRPHRLSRILDAPQAIEPVPHELLEQLAGKAAPAPSPAAPRGVGPPRFSVETWIRDYKLAVREPVPHDGGRKWVLEACPFNGEHRAPDAAIFEGADGKPGFKCLHNSCSGYHWRELREHIEPARAKRETPKHREPPEPPRVIDCAALLRIETPVEEMLFDDGYPLPMRGAILKVGASKTGKTLLAVQECVAIASGRPLFGHYKVRHPGPVLIVEKDDPGGAASIAAIVRRSGGTADLPLYVVDKLTFGFGQQMIDWLREQITSLKLRLLILDSFTSLRGSRTPGTDVVKAEQLELTRLDELSKELGSGIEIIHHGSKTAAALDWTQNAAGSFAMTAATEAQFHVSRFPELDGAASERLVRIRGRHAADAQMVVRFRKETLDYELVLDGAAAPFYPLVEQIRREFEGKPFKAKEFIDATGVSRATGFRQLDRLRQAGAVSKEAMGYYILTAGETVGTGSES